MRSPRKIQYNSGGVRNQEFGCTAYKSVLQEKVGVKDRTIRGGPR